MSDKHYTVNIESIVKNLESLFENELAEMKVVRSDEHIEMCKILFSHNIRYMRVFLGFISKGSPYEQKEFAGLLTVSTAGLRRWENAEVIPNKAGLKNVVGKTVLDILPNTEPYWIETFGNVALTGKPDSLTEYAGEFGKYYEVHGYSPKKGQFAVTFMDVTERVMALNKKDT